MYSLENRLRANVKSKCEHLSPHTYLCRSSRSGNRQGIFKDLHLSQEPSTRSHYFGCYSQERQKFKETDLDLPGTAAEARQPLESLLLLRH